MGYIIDLIGIRDDFRSTFDFYKNRHFLFKQEQSLLSEGSNLIKTFFPTVKFNSILDELNFVIKKLTNVGVKEIIVVDTSPLEKFKLKSVKVIIPGLELVSITPYKPSPLYEAKVKQTIFTITCWIS